MSDAKVRLYVEQPLGQGQSVPLTDDQSHYVLNVMRLGAGDHVLLFNGRDGEWIAKLDQINRRRVSALCEVSTRRQDDPPDLWLLFAPLKKVRTDFVVEKAVELGVRRILPIQTDFTNAERIRQDRLQAHAREAAEQCGATFVPDVAELSPLPRVLAGWESTRTLWFADENSAHDKAAGIRVVGLETDARAAILIGPEGGFSQAERERLRALPFVRRMSLGPRILRAETAAVSALTLWQSRYGDWV